MVVYFYSYIKNIILFLIFMSFIQVILPNSKYRSYINLVFGMILIFIMISPLKIMFNNVKSIESFKVFNEDIEANINIDTKKYIDIQNKMVENAFKDNIKMQIQNILKDKYIVQEIDLKLSESKYKEINISQIELTLTKTKKDIYVKPFNEDKNIENMKNKEIDNIKNIICNFYNITIDSIFITIA